MLFNQLHILTSFVPTATSVPITAAPTVAPTVVPVAPTTIQPTRLVRPQIVHLYQADFANGPYVISEPGTYVLMEDIVFDPFPNAFEDIFDHLASFPAFDHQYVLGFFAAIIIFGHDIVLDLNQHQIRQSALHSLQQRFFALIELANRPFLPTQGPADFGSPLVGCTNVTIRNGVLGLSSHHAVHGNNATNVTIQDVTIFDYEVAGITLNGCRNVRIERVDIRQNFKNIKVNGFFSNAVFMVKKLLSIQKGETDTLSLPHEGATIGVTALNQFWPLDLILDRLRNSVVDAYDDLINQRNVGSKNPDSLMYANSAPYVTDGNCYGISFNTTGLLVNNYKHVFVPGSSTIYINDVTISDIDCKPVEYRVVCDLPYETIRQLPEPQTHSAVNKGPFGEIIDYFRCIDSSQAFAPVNNPLILAQVLAGTVSPTLKEWIEKGIVSDWTATTSVLTNLDIMAHAMKGTIGLFLSSVENVNISNLKIRNIRNRSARGHDAYFSQNGTTYHGARTAGVLLASSRNVSFNKTTIHNIVSDVGEAYGFYLHGACTSFTHLYDNIGSLRVTNDYQNVNVNTPCMVQSLGIQR